MDMTAIDYQKQATDFLEKHGIDFSFSQVGHDCPTFCEDARLERDMDKVNDFPRKTHIHGKHYRCTFKRKDKQFTIDFWSSYADEEYNALFYHEGNLVVMAENVYWDKYGKYPRRLRDMKGKRRPTPYDVLAAVTKNDPGTFENFCGDYGYDTDSRRAEGVYKAVQVEYAKMQAFFTEEELTELQDIN
jgi:hypothetical protein